MSERLLRIQYLVSDGDGRSVKWDERKAGDYSAAAAALMAVAMGDDDFRREVVRLAEDRSAGITGLLDGESGELIGVGVFGHHPPGLRAKENPPSVAEWVANPDNAREVVAVLARRGVGDAELTEDEAIRVAVARMTANPMVLSIVTRGLAPDGRGLKMAVWRDEDRLYEGVAFNPDPEVDRG